MSASVSQRAQALSRAAILAISLSAALLAPAGAQTPCNQELPAPAPTAASAARAAGGFGCQESAVDGPCTCEELRQYLKKDVEKKKNCYKQAYDVGRSQPFAGQAAVNSFVETCMGWKKGSAQSQGKPSGAAPEEQKSAYEKCRRCHCQWICDGPVNCVHEQYHDWYKTHMMVEMMVANMQSLFDWSLGPMSQAQILDEIGAHEAEEEFLQDRIEEAEATGKCAGVSGSIQEPERDLRHQEASRRTQRYVDSLGGEQ